MSTSDGINLNPFVEGNPRPDTSDTMQDLQSPESKWGSESVWPSKSSLGRYETVFMVLASLNGLLYAWSKFNNGLTGAGGCLQFVLVRGPTAVLFLVTCFWCHTEFQIRRSAPERDGASIFGPLRQAHHRPVPLAVACSVLVKLLVIASTGLVVREPMKFADQTPLEISTAFSGADYIGNSSDWTSFGHVYLTQKYGNEYPFGTKGEYAFQSFNIPSDLASKKSISGVVDVFHAEFPCNVLLDNVTIPISRNDSGGFAPVTFHPEPSVELSVEYFDLQIITPGCQLKLPIAADSGLESYWINCHGSSEDTVDKDAGDLALHQATPVFDEEGELTGQRLTTVLCRPRYNILQGNLVIENPATPLTRLETLSGGSSNRTIPGINMRDIFRGMEQVMRNFPGGTESQFSYTSALKLDFPESDIISWHDGKTLKQAAEQLLPRMAAQTAYFHLLKPSHGFTGTITTTEDRLVVKGIPITLMSLIIGLLVSIIGQLQSSNPKHSHMLRKRPVQPYQDTELYRVEEPKPHALEKFDAPRFSEANPAGEQIRVDNEEPYESHVRWEVPKLSYWQELVLLATPVALIALLEHFFQCSRHHNGLKDIYASDSFTAISWPLVPPLLVLGISTCYDHWAFRFHALQQHRHVNLKAETTGVQESRNSLPHRGYITTAVMITSFITTNLLLVVSSGLFITETTDNGTPVSVIQEDSFDFSTIHPSNTGLDTELVNLNSSKSQWTSGDLTFPSFTPPTNNSTTMPEDNALITVMLPASRTRSNCTALSSENVEFSHLPKNVGAYINITAPSGCASAPFHLKVPYGYFGLAQMIGESLDSMMSPECGRWLVSTGYTDSEDTSNSTATFLLCNPSAETVQAKVTFHASSLEIDRSNPPIVHGDTATHAAFFLDQSETYPVGYLQEFMHRLARPARLVSPDYYADELFQLMVSETAPVDYVGEKNVHRLQAAVQAAFGVRQAQHTNYYSRQSLPEEHRPELNATLWNPTRVRIVQDAGSTYVLQSLLGWLSICAIAHRIAIGKDQKASDKKEREGLLDVSTRSEYEDDEL